MPPNHCQLNETVGGLDEVDHHRNREVAIDPVGGLDEVDHHRNREVAVDHVGVDQVKVILKLNRVS